MQRTILHLDMDAFFAAIEERDYPEFRGFPIVVGADPKDGMGRGVVSTANYAARKYGVHSAQPISTAWRLCKQGEIGGGKKCVFFGGNFEKYGSESDTIMGIIARYGEKLEQVSVDEAYLIPKIPISKPQVLKEAERIAKQIKDEIYTQTRLTCSIGIGPNKLVAKIASDVQKPNGLTVISPERVQEFLGPLSVRVIPGIGPKTENELARFKVRAIAQLRALPHEMLLERFGAWGATMYESARGIDNRSVGEERTIRSLGREHTFANDISNAPELLETLSELASQVARDVEQEGVGFRTVEIKVRFADFRTTTRQTTLSTHTHSANKIERAALRLFLPFLDRRENPKTSAIRLFGIRVGGLKAEGKDLRRSELHRTASKI